MDIAHEPQQMKDRQRMRRLADLQVELTQAGSAMELEALQSNLLRGACQVMQSRHSVLILLDGEHDEWLTYKALDAQGAWLYQVRPTAGKGLVQECLRSGQMLRVNQLAADPRFNSESDLLAVEANLPARSMMLAPLLINGRLLGAIQIFDRLQGDYDAYDQDLFLMIATLAANVLYAAHLAQQFKVANADLQASRWELVNARNTLQTLFDSLPAAIYIIDQKYQLIAVNPSSARRSGGEAQSLLGRACYQALYGRSDACPGCRVLETLQQGSVTQRSARRWGSAEDPFDWEIYSYPIYDRDRQVVQAVLVEQDETEKRRLENVLAQSEKLAAIGQLAAGVAHEINNPLTAIIANAQILHRELPANSDMQESVDLIARAGARATQVVRNLLDFARKEDYHLAITNINETLQKALALVQHELMARSVRLSFDPDPSLPPILASQDHLQSVWLNLLINAVDSLDKPRGEICITTRQVNQEVQISISDNGKGIPAERLPRIFEPFYTTKAPGRGTGLGLSVSNRIIKQHGGHILVESQLGSGTTFTVALPIT